MAGFVVEVIVQHDPSEVGWYAGRGSDARHIAALLGVRICGYASGRFSLRRANAPAMTGGFAVWGLERMRSSRAEAITQAAEQPR